MAAKAPTHYNLADPAFLRDPSPMLSEMRSEGQLVKIKIPIVGEMWVTTTHAATLEVAKGKDRFFLTGEGAGLKRKGNASLPWWMPPTIRAMADNMLGKDDPEHRRLRKLVDQAFARRGIREMRPAIATIAANYVASLRHELGNEIDIVPGFCRRFPLEVIAELLGVPEAERDTFADLGGSIGDLGGPLSIINMLRKMSKFYRHLRAMVSDMRETPRSGLISELIALEGGDDHLSNDELISMVFLLLFAGFETTTNLIAGSVIALERNPEQKAWLFEDFDGRIDIATEELCRHVSSVSGTKPRIVSCDTQIQGQRVNKGDKVMALPIAANYDPVVFENPEQLQLDRLPNPHLAFSAGNHFCLGMQLARVELQEALRALYRAWPDLELADETLEYAKRPGHRALTSLRLRLK